MTRKKSGTSTRKKSGVKIGENRYTFDCDGKVATINGGGVGWPHNVGYRGMTRQDLEAMAARGGKVKLDWRVSDECGKPASERKRVPAVDPESLRT